MGLFSSKKKTYVDTSVVRLMEDIQVPTPLLAAQMEVLFNESTLMDEIRRHSIYGSFRNFERMYRYAARGDYFYGLPDARVLTSSDGFPLAKQAIEAEVGQAVTIDYMHYRPLNNTHAGWKFLVEEWGYNHTTNTIGALNALFPEITFYLEKMVAVHQTVEEQEPEKSSLGTFGNSPMAGTTPDRPVFTEDPELKALVVEQEVRTGPTEVESVEIHYTWLDGNDEVQQDMHVVDLSGYDGDQEFYQARYRYGSVIGYWIYDPSTGSHTALNNVFAFQAYVSPGTYFPFAVFRREKQNRATPALENTEEYKTTKKLLDYIGMDFQEVADSIHENPDITDIEQAVMIMGVPITTEDQVELDYLYRYFKDLLTRLPAQSLSGIPSYRLSSTPDTSYAVEISDADFRMTMSFAGVTRKLKVGSIGSVGTYQNLIVMDSAGITTLPGFGVPIQGIASIRARAIRKQITPQVYEELRLEDPQMRWDIDNKRSVTGGIDDERFLIPLDYNIVRTMPLMKREVLYYRSVHFIFNSRVVVKTKWYETGIFKALLVIVAVAITIYTGFSDGGALMKTVATAIGTGAAATAAQIALAKIILGAFLKMVVFQFIFAKIVDLVGMDIAMFLAIAAAAYGGYKAIQGSKGFLNLDAADFLKASTGLTSAIQTEMKGLFQDLQQEMDQLTEFMKSEWERLEDALKLLDQPGALDPGMFIGRQPLTVFGESPDDYFNRTIHAGNVGTRSLDIVQNYVAISLRLPTLDETVGVS